MKIYSAHGLNDFVICLGYKGYVIKEYFSNYFLHTSDVTFDLATNERIVHKTHSEPWRVTLVDTGEETETGGRLKRITKYLDDDLFCFTYGDGVADLNVGALIQFARDQGTLATVTAVQPPGRYGALEVHGTSVSRFKEKPQGDGGWTNGGFFVLSPGVMQYIDGDDTSWEAGPLEGLARDSQCSAFRHRGFWHAVDTLRDLLYLEQLWASGKAPWKQWT
jgi:glucose-1-phosphate cytidylyltransferase